MRRTPCDLLGRYHPNEFWMLTLYAKARQESIPAHILRQIEKEFEHE